MNAIKKPVNIVDVTYAQTGASVNVDAMGMREMQQRVTEIDIDTDEELTGRYGWDVPVVLLEGRQHSFHRVDRDRLSRALEALGA